MKICSCIVANWKKQKQKKQKQTNKQKKNKKTQKKNTISSIYKWDIQDSQNIYSEEWKIILNASIGLSYLGV